MGAGEDLRRDGSGQADGPSLEPVAPAGSVRGRATLLLVGLCVLGGIALTERWREDAAPAFSGSSPRPASTAVAQPSLPAPPVSAATPVAGRPPAPIVLPDDRSAMLLEAAGRAAGAAGTWGVGGLVAPVRSQQPNSAPLDPALLGQACAGGRLLTTEQVVVVGYRGRQPTQVTVTNVAAGGPPAEVDVAVELDAVDGALLLVPSHDRVWRPGYYAVTLARPPSRSGADRPPGRLVFCVGMYEPNGALMVPPSIGREQMEP